MMADERMGGWPDRRDFIKGLAAAYGLPSPAVAEFARQMRQGQYQWKFFTAPELAMMRPLADLVIPRDARGPSATETGTVEYADFIISIGSDGTKNAWHEGFAWLEAECGRRFQKGFAACSEAERRQVLDDIAWPARATEERRAAAAWFNRVRDLVGSGYFSSREGVEDLQYLGGVFNPDWRGAPDEVLRELGLSYEEWDRKYGDAR